MTTYKVSELQGALLDAAVAMAFDMDFTIDEGAGSLWVFTDGGEWAPSTNWQQGGPIIESEHIAVYYLGDTWLAECLNNSGRAKGDTPLIAVARAKVTSVFGDTVEMP